MELIELKYKKPLRLIDVVYNELRESYGETARALSSILWRHNAPTIPQIEAVLETLLAQGRVCRRDGYWSTRKWEDENDYYLD